MMAIGWNVQPTRRDVLRILAAAVAGGGLMAGSNGCGGPKPTMENSGGTTLVYRAASHTDLNDAGDRELLPSVLRRIDPHRRLKGVVIRRVGEDQLEIRVPNQPSVDLERIKSRMAMRGRLEFLILADARFHDDILQMAKQQPTKLVTLEDGSVVGKWVSLGKLKDIDPDMTPVERLVLRDQDGKLLTVPPADPQRADGWVLKWLERNGVRELEALCVTDPNGLNFNDEHLQRVYLANDLPEHPAIGFQATEMGARLLTELTTKRAVRKPGQESLMAVIIDDRLISAPKIMAPITAAGQLHGNFSEAEAKDLVSVLSMGRLPIELEPQPISEIQVQAEP